jgi:uncharacterized protein (DUF849 family)
MPGARAISTAGQILRRLDHLAVTAPRLHGEQDSCWPLLMHASKLGLPTRVGLEDTLTGPDGRPATGNAHLVQLALALIRT